MSSKRKHIKNLVSGGLLRSRHPSKPTVPPSSEAARDVIVAAVVQPVAPPPVQKPPSQTHLSASFHTDSKPSNAAPDLWRDAFDAVPLATRNWIQDNLSLSDQTISSNIETIALLTQLKREECERKRLKFTFCNKEIILRDVAEKVIFWLNKFKEVGDIVVNYDPVHLAIPWAGVRLVLQCAVQENQQMGAMLLGMERMAYLISRGKIYELLYLQEQDLDSSGQTLRVALMKLYIELLQFVVYAYQFFEKHFLDRVLTASFGTSDLQRFLDQFGSLEDKIDREARVCESVYRHNEHRKAKFEIDGLQNLLRGMSAPILRTDNRVADLWNRSNESEVSEILCWVSRVPHEDNHKTARAGHVEGTGQWLLDHGTYSEWRKSSASTILWLHGIPGAGKTKLVTCVVEEILQRLRQGPNDEAFAYFYCDHNDRDRRSPLSVLQSFVKQLAKSQYEDVVQNSLVEIYKSKKRSGFGSNHLDERECKDLLLQFVNVYPQTTIVLDALDESDPETRQGLVDIVIDIVHQSEKPVKIFISSRLNEDIKYRLDERPNIGINANDNQKDIAMFVKDRLSTSDRYRREKLSVSIRREITEKILYKSDGMFQWAHLQINQLMELKIEDEMRTRLGKLPRGLLASYEEIYKDIVRGECSMFATRAFSWVMQTVKPLSPEQLVAAVCQDTVSSRAENVTISIELLLDACKNLLVVDQQLNLCRFSHASVQEYLEENHVNPVDADAIISKVSLQMLIDDSPDVILSTEFRERCFKFNTIPPAKHTHEFDTYRWLASEGMSRYRDKRLNDLFTYIVNYWPVHVRRCEVIALKDDLLGLLIQFLSRPDGRSVKYLQWLNMFYFGDEGIWTLEWNVDASKLIGAYCDPISVMCLFGFDSVLGSWWASILENFERYRQEGIVLLQCAILAKEPKLCQQLLALNIDVNQNGPYNEPSLVVAAKTGFRIAVELLVKHGANINQTGPYGGALYMASEYGHLEIVELLLDNGVDINQDGRDGGALYVAAGRGHLDIVRLLLDRGADISQAGVYGGALCNASGNNHLAIVKLLLDRETDIDQSGPYGSALQLASERGHLDIISLLLDRGVNVNQNGPYGSALQLACECGQLEVVKYLLARGANINQNGRAGSALLLASEHGQLRIAKHLLDSGADVHQGKRAKSALLQASLSSNLHIVKLLLDHGASLNEVGQDYSQALEVALRQCDDDIAKLLTSRGAQREAQKRHLSHDIGEGKDADDTDSLADELDMIKL